MQLSIIIPTFNEAEGIEACLEALQPLRQHCQLIVADGGSTDRTKELCAPLVDKVIACGKGRARQMNAGAEHADAEILLFLHADTLLPENALGLINQAINRGYVWGRFDIQLTGSHPMLIINGFMMNLRSRLTGIATGDQGLFMTREAFEQAGRFPDIALMEDIEISSKLKRLSKPCCISDRVISSGRRWEKFGVFKTILLMWFLRLAYFLGVNPKRLAVIYSNGSLWKHSSASPYS